MTNFDKDLDARGLNCPLPILRAKKALTEMSTGQVLRIVATDPGSVATIRSTWPLDSSVSAFFARRIGSGQLRPRASRSLSKFVIMVRPPARHLRLECQ